MLSEHGSLPGRPTDAAASKMEPASAFGRAKPQITPPAVTYSFAINPALRAWRHAAKADRLPPVAPPPFDTALDCFEIPLPSWKRAIDLAACLVGLPLLGLLVLVMFLLTRRVSPGPVFFRQERIGYRGRRFQIYKFRTMKVGADRSIHQEYCKALIQTNAPMVKLDSRGDSRLIPSAWLLRASGLDELPQLINVLRGEMSLVGPRPCLSAEFEQCVLWQRQRCDARPGLTGLWQVSGKNRTTFEQMIGLDIKYAHECSLWLDLKIIILTVPCLVAQVRDSLRARKSPPPSGHRGPPETPNRVAPDLLGRPAVARGNGCAAS